MCLNLVCLTWCITNKTKRNSISLSIFKNYKMMIIFSFKSQSHHTWSVLFENYKYSLELLKLIAWHYWWRCWWLERWFVMIEINDLDLEAAVNMEETCRLVDHVDREDIIFLIRHFTVVTFRSIKQSISLHEFWRKYQIKIETMWNG